MPRAASASAASAGLLVAGRVLATAASAASVSSAPGNGSSASTSGPGNASSTEPHAANSSAAFANIDDGGGVDPRDFAQGYTDVQTLMLAGVCTLIVLVFALGAGFAVRIAWRKLRERAADGYTGVVHRDDSSDPLGAGGGGGGGGGRANTAASSLSSGNLLADELKACGAQTAGGATTDDASSRSPLLDGSASGGGFRNHANGSVITMTLKNNHLIVETQDRAVRLQDGATKTTTTTFTTSASPEHEPVFVVEVTQPRGYSALPACAEMDNPGGGGCGPAMANGEAASSQRAQVHRADTADDDEEAAGARASVSGPPAGAAPAAEAASGAAAPRRSNTGLSQSDLSVSSAGSANPSYRYGNQLGYDGGPFGYPQYAGYCVEPPAPGASVAAPGAAGAAEAASATPGSARRPVFWGGQDSMLSSDQQSERLLSDILQEELLQEEQRQLGNGGEAPAAGGHPPHLQLHRTGSLPPRVRADAAQGQPQGQGPLDGGSGRLEPVVEAAGAAGAAGAARSPRKRASLPAIACQASPRLRGPRDDASPLREADDRSPEAALCAGGRTLQDAVGGKTFGSESFVVTDGKAS